MENPRTTTNDGERDVESGTAASADELQRRQRGSVPSFLFITFLFFMLTNRNEEDVVMRVQYEDAIRALGYQLSNYSAWLNGTATNFTLPERDDDVEQLVSKILPPPYQLHPSFGSYYSNATGVFRGDIRYYNLSSIPYDTNVTWKPIADHIMKNANLSAITERQGTWDWSSADTVEIKVHDRMMTVANVSEDMAIVQGKFELTDPEVAETMVLEFDGVHFTKNGSFYAFAQGEGSSSNDIRYLPSVVPVSAQNATAAVLQQEMNHRLSKLRTMADWGAMVQQLSASKDKPGAHGCPFIFYGQLTPTHVPEKLMLELEQEVFEPSGISVVDPPNMALDGVLISKSCGILYHIDESAGINTWSYSRQVITYAGWSSMIYLVMLFLHNHQAAASETPAGLSQLSRWTFFAQAAIDSVAFAIFISLAVVVGARACIPLIAPAALSVILLFCEMQLSVLIHRVQLPEDNALNQATQVPNPPTTNTSTNTGTTDDENASRDSEAVVLETAPPADGGTTGTAGTETPGFIRSLIDYIWSDPHLKTWTILSFCLTVVSQLLMWFSVPLLGIAAAYLMFWLPQIARSALRGRTAALTTEYLIGMTVCRLLFAIYYLGYSENVLQIAPRPWLWTFAGCMILQVFVILLQDLYGPSFFLPARFITAKTYDYHPPMQLPDPESSNPESPDHSLGDCAICMDAIIVDPSPGEKGTSTSKEATWGGTAEGPSHGIFSILRRNVVGTATMRKSYSLAPCHHLFHTSCLETWLAIKNICPQCRRPLPPL